MREKRGGGGEEGRERENREWRSTLFLWRSDTLIQTMLGHTFHKPVVSVMGSEDGVIPKLLLMLLDNRQR